MVQHVIDRFRSGRYRADFHSIAGEYLPCHKQIHILIIYHKSPYVSGVQSSFHFPQIRPIRIHKGNDRNTVERLSHKPDSRIIGYLEGSVAYDSYHHRLRKFFHELRIFLIFLLSHKNMRKPGRLSKFFEASHVVRTLHFNFKTQHHVLYHGIVECPDMGIPEFFKMEICPEAQFIRILNTHAVLISDDFLRDTDADRRSDLRLTVYLKETVQASGEAVYNRKT